MISTSSIHSFIIRMWLEEGLEEEQFWRGHIIHVHSQQEKYFQNLDDIPDYIAQYLTQPKSAADT